MVYMTCAPGEYLLYSEITKKKRFEKREKKGERWYGLSIPSCEYHDEKDCCDNY